MASKQVIVLSDEAAAFMNEPARMPVVEDIYAISDRRAWVVVCTEIQGEKKALTQLEEARVSSFMPIERKYEAKVVTRDRWYAGIVRSRRNKTIRKPVDRPLLPGYLFVEVPLVEEGGVHRVSPRGAAAITAQDSVSRILGTASGPLPVPNEFVDILRQQQVEGAFDRTSKKPDWAKKGAKTKINDGPFATFLGVIEECLPNDLVKVAVDIFGRSTPVTLELAQIENVC